MADPPKGLARIEPRYYIDMLKLRIIGRAATFVASTSERAVAVALGPMRLAGSMPDVLVPIYTRYEYMPALEVKEAACRSWKP
jgi:hypothetical protein